MTKTTRRIGRPMKYAACLVILKDDLIYSPGAIAHMALEYGLLGHFKEDKDRANAVRRLRHSLNRYRINHNFGKPQGVVKIDGQGPSFGWLGSLWKSRLNDEVRQAAKGEAYLVGNEAKYKLIEEGYPPNVRAVDNPTTKEVKKAESGDA